MDTEDKIKEIRLEKAELLQQMAEEYIKNGGKNWFPYPSRSERSDDIIVALKHFNEWKRDQDNIKKNDSKIIILAGRIMSQRGQGNIIFLDVQDYSGSIQFVLKKEDCEHFSFFKKFAVDIGDFIQATGYLFETKTTEKSLLVTEWKILTKSISPLPSGWHGFKDVEERFRKRYLDILMDTKVKEMFLRKSQFWQTIRNFLLKKGFLEVETPVLESVPGGADAKPFKTHHNALDMEVFLRISPELWLKRLMVAGFPKVFEIGRIFRNEGMDAEHLQDYTQMEFYWPYADYNDGMKLVEEMYKKVAKEVYGKTNFLIKGFNIDLAKKWKTYKYVEIIEDKTGINILKTNLEEIQGKLKDLKIDYDEKGFNLTRAIDNLWKYCRKDIAGPGFLVDVPVFMEPLAKKVANNPILVERFQVILAGSEMGKGFSELNDPKDQRKRFEEQAKLREGGDEEAQRTDNDFVEALEYGMPPTCGFGISERLFAFLEDKSVRETTLFPLMRKKEE